MKWGFIWYFHIMNVALHSSLESSIIRFSEQTKTKKSDIFFFYLHIRR